MSSQKDDDNKQSQKRRTTLKTLLAGGGVVTLGALPTRWFKPVVDSVSLPAHAQTSGESGRAHNGFQVTLLSGKTDWLDSIFPKAYAGFRSPRSGFLCIEATGSESIKASFEVDSSSTVLAGSGGVNTCIVLRCSGSPEELNLKVTSINNDGSFDFELSSAGSECSEPVAVATTDTPCDTRAADCEIEIEMELELNPET